MISPQGYSYGKKPQSVNPFWDEDTEPVYFKEFTENKVLTEVDSLCYFIQFYVNEVPAAVSTTLCNTLLDTELCLPFILNDKSALLVCESTEINNLKIVGVLAHEPIDTVRIDLVSGKKVAHDGKDGKDGEIGPEGPQGDPGPVGPPGDPGPEGPAGKDGVTPTITATASVDNNTGTPSVEVTKTGTNTEPTFAFAFSGLKGEKGDTGQKGDPGPEGPPGEPGPKGEPGKDGTLGATPDITVTAAVDETGGVPDVNVTKSGTILNPIFDFAFTGLKGDKGDVGPKGDQGPEGPQGPKGSDGVTPTITATASVDANTGTPSVEVTKSGTDAAPTFNFAFTGLKGEGGSSEEWKTLQTTNGNIKNIMTQLNNLNATKVYLDNIKIAGFQNQYSFNILFINSGTTITSWDHKFSRVSLDNDLHDIIAEKIDGKWVCTGRILNGIDGTAIRFTDTSSNSNELMLYEPVFAISLNNLASSSSNQLQLSLVSYGSAHVASNSYDSTKVLSIAYSGEFFVREINATQVKYM